MSESEYLSRNASRYLLVTPGALYESSVQALVERNLTALFPGYRGGRLEPRFQTPIGGVKPDLVLVQGDLQGWALVEVEVDSHSMTQHSLAQFLRLRAAAADHKLARVVRDKFLPDVGISQIEAALERPPRVSLVVQGDSKGLAEALAPHQVDVIEIDVNESKDLPNEYILVVRDRSVSWVLVPGVVRRSTSPLTRHLWSVSSQQIPPSLLELVSVEVLLADTRSMWKVFPSGHDLILRQPTDLIVPVEGNSAALYWNDESRAVKLLPTEEGS